MSRAYCLPMPLMRFASAPDVIGSSASAIRLAILNSRRQPPKPPLRMRQWSGRFSLIGASEVPNVTLWKFTSASATLTPAEQCTCFIASPPAPSVELQNQPRP